MDDELAWVNYVQNGTIENDTMLAIVNMYFQVERHLLQLFDPHRERYHNLAQLVDADPSVLTDSPYQRCHLDKMTHYIDRCRFVHGPHFDLTHEADPLNIASAVVDSDLNIAMEALIATYHRVFE